MGRKNSRAYKVRRNRPSQDSSLNSIRQANLSDPTFSRVDLKTMVIPDGECFFQTPRKAKKRYATYEKASKALDQAQAERIRTGSVHHMEKRVYKCPEGGCDGFHLSSREAFDMDIWKQRREMHDNNQPGGQP